MFSELKLEAEQHQVYALSLLQYKMYFECQWLHNSAVPKRMWNVQNAAKKETQ